LKQVKHFPKYLLHQKLCLKDNFSLMLFSACVAW